MCMLQTSKWLVIRVTSLHTVGVIPLFTQQQVSVTFVTLSDKRLELRPFKQKEILMLTSSNTT